MDQKYNKAAGIFSLFFMLVSYNHCIQAPVNKSIKGRNTDNNDGFTQNTTIGSGNNTTVESPDVFVPQVNIVSADPINEGIKNYEQIYLTMAAVTDIDPNDSSTKNIYKEIKTQLPNNNDLKSFLAANQVGIIKLASEFCHRLVENGTKRSQIWPTINFGSNPTQALSSTNRDLVVNQVLDSFWGPDVDMVVRGMAVLELRALINDLLVGENLTSSTTTRNTIKGVCIATLSSANVTML